MNVFLNMFIFAWIARISGNLLSWIKLWYIKEYRFDRMIIHLKKTRILQMVFPSWRRPSLHPKTIVLILISFISLAFIFWLIPSNIIIKLLVVDLISFLFLSLWVFILGIPTKIYHKIIIFKAAKKIRNHTKLTVIGITGSYGKTTTKEYLATILGTKFKTLKTEASKNSTIGVAEVVLRKLTDQEIFIVEMGAYKKGEIFEICRLVKPQIGIITGINEQHLELFGSLANIRNAKYELIESLPQNGLAVFNADNKFTRLMSKKTKKIHKILYGKAADANLRIYDIKQTKNNISFWLKFNKEKLSVSMSLLGVHQASNIAAAVSVAYHMGLSTSEIRSAVGNLHPFSGTIQKVGEYNGATLIDDSFNANPDAVRSVIDYMQLYSGRKYLVFTPMIELGSQTNSIHESIAAHAALNNVEIISTNSDNLTNLVSGMRKFHREPILASGVKGVKILKEKLRPGDVVTFEGREALNTLNLMMKKGG